MSCPPFFFFNDTATTEIYTLSLHDALPILHLLSPAGRQRRPDRSRGKRGRLSRSEEHTSELQSHVNLVCRLLLEKKKHRTYDGDLLVDAVPLHQTVVLTRHPPSQLNGPALS